MRQRWMMPVAVVALGAALSACATSGSGNGTGNPAAADKTQGVTDNSILIEGFGPLTGPASWVGLGNRDGFTLAVNEINAAGGINGRKIRFKFLDDAFQVSQAQQDVRQIVDQDKPFLIYAGTGSTTFQAVADELRQSGIPTYNGFSGSEGARETPEVPTMYHGEAVSTKWVVPAETQLVTQTLGAKRIALMHEDGEWGKALCQGISDSLKQDSSVKVVTEQTYAAAGTDFTPQLIAVRNAKPQVVVNCGLFPAAKIILRQANELGIKAQFVGDAGQANATVWSGGGPATQDWIFNWYEPYFMTVPTGPMADFLAKYKKAYPNAPVGRPSHADTFSYGAAYLIKHALEQAGRNLTAQKFLDAMHSIQNFKATPISPTANCDNNRNECFTHTVWMIVKNGQPRQATDADFAEIRKKIGA